MKAFLYNISRIIIMFFKFRMWEKYYLQTQHTLPSPLLVQAIHFPYKYHHALDLGCGSGKDTRLLLQHFKFVTAVDKQIDVTKYVASIPSFRLITHLTTFEKFEFVESYDLVSAQWALPFNPPSTLNSVINNIIISLNKGGIFCGQFLGIEDGWNNSVDQKKFLRVFHTHKEVKQLFSGLELIQFSERRYNKPTASGLLKHWHVFNIIAQKN